MNVADIRSDVKRLEFHIIYRCVDRCIFCSEEFHMKEFGDFPVSREEIFSMLEKKREEGFGHLTLTGGEPTLYPKFWEIAAFAKKIGYRVFVITNGSALGNSQYAERLLPHIDELCLSIHGPNQEVHDEVTRVKGSFEKLMSAIEHVSNYGRLSFVMVNHVVTRLNAGLIPETFALLSRGGQIHQFLISNVTPHGGGGAHYSELAVRHQEITEHLPALDLIAKKSGIALRFYGIPVCLLGPYWRYSNDLFYTPRTTIARSRLENGSVGWHFEDSPYSYREKFYPEVCGACVLKGRCGGIYWDYTQVFREENLKPFTASSLRASSLPQGVLT